MKRILTGVAVLAFTWLAPLAQADTSTNQPATVEQPWSTRAAKGQYQPAAPNQNALRKLGRGLSNVLFGIVEVPNQYTRAVNDNGGGAGLTYGLPRGILCWLGREVVGVYEVVTFPLPLPKGYKPIIKPEWPNEDYEP
jgi:putative exosortase-associated protein (TIGR04073 family)